MENPLDEESSSDSDDEGGNPMVVGYDDDVSSIDDVTSDSSDDGVYDVTENKIVTSQSEVVKDVEVENKVEDDIEEEKVIFVY